MSSRAPKSSPKKPEKKQRNEKTRWDQRHNLRAISKQDASAQECGIYPQPELFGGDEK
jgi:hypothetical protein